MRRADSFEDSDAGKDWGQEEKGTTEDEMVGWHHWLNGHGFGWTVGADDGQEGLVCCSSWDHKESDMAEWLDWTELNWMMEHCHVCLTLDNTQLRWAALGILSLGVHSQELIQSLLGPNSKARSFFFFFFSIKDKIYLSRKVWLSPQTHMPSFVIIWLGSRLQNSQNILISSRDIGSYWSWDPFLFVT